MTGQYQSLPNPSIGASISIRTPPGTLNRLTRHDCGLLVGPELVVCLARVLPEVALVHARDAQHVPVPSVADHRRGIQEFPVLESDFKVS